MAIFKKNQDKKNVGSSTVTDLKDKVLFESRLRKITNKIHSSPNIDVILLEIKDEILSLLDTQRLTIYALSEDRRHIYSKIKVGQDIQELKIPIDNTSIAGYVARNKIMLTIKDAYDLKELNTIDPLLCFNREFDLESGFRTKQVLATPIMFSNKLMGVIQLINKKDGSFFSSEDKQALKDIAETLAIAFHNNLRIQMKQLSKFELLVLEDKILRSEIEKAVQIAREEKESTAKILIDRFNIDKQDVGRALSNFYRVPFFEFKAKIPIPDYILNDLDPAFLRNHLWVPLRKEGDVITIITNNPKDLEKIDDIKRQLDTRSIRFCIAIREDILKTIDYFFGADEVDQVKTDEKLGSLLSDVEIDEMANTVGGEEIEDEENIVCETDSTVIRLVNQILIEAYQLGASDIHVEPGMGKKKMIIRLRIDGKCQIFKELPNSLKRSVVSRIKIMSDLDIAEKRKPQDGKIQFKKFGGPDIELRVATLPTVGHVEDVVLRILASSEPIPLEKIGMLESNFDKFQKAIQLPYGIILVVGPTGSGKTTTLHSALGYINKPDRKIWTAEDPVEITQEGLRQVQVMPKIGYTFAAAMRAFLRADPDVIMVGEMRDAETASMGVEASLTGHLVFSTLHTNSAPETITRLLDIGIDPFNFADALIAVLAQRLVRTLCKNCKEQYQISPLDFEQMATEYGKSDFAQQALTYDNNSNLYRAKGCQICMDTGYKGRMGIHELLLGSDGIKKLIQDKAPVDNIRQLACKEGMTSLKQDGILKVFQGHTSIDQVRAVCIK